MELLAHAGDAQLYLLIPGVVFFVVYRLVRGPLPEGDGQPKQRRSARVGERA